MIRKVIIITAQYCDSLRCERANPVLYTEPMPFSTPVVRKQYGAYDMSNRQYRRHQQTRKRKRRK